MSRRRAALCRARAAWIALAASTGCSSAVAVPWPELASARTWILAELASNGEVRALRYVDPSRTELIDARDDARREVLAFAESPAELTAPPDDEGRITLGGPDAWTLPPPLSAWSLEAGGPAETGAVWREALAVARPPCPSFQARIIAFPPLEGVTVRSAVVRDDEIWIGVTSSSVSALFRARHDLSDLRRVTSLASRDVPAPISYLDGDRLWVNWSSKNRPNELLALDRDGAVVETRTATPARNLDALTGRGDEIVARTSEDGSIVVLDPSSGGWRAVAALRPSPCGTSLRRQVFELRAPGRLLAGLDDGTIAEIDLTRVDAPLGPTLIREFRICRSAYAQSASLELLSVRRGSDSDGAAFWRRPGQEWIRDARGDVADGGGVALRGRSAAVLGSGSVVFIYEDTPSRPELLPRRCGVAPAGGIDLLGVTPIDDHRFLGWGVQGAVLVELGLEP